MSNGEKGRSITSKPETTFDEMLNAIGDCLSNLASSGDKKDGEDEDDDEDDTELGKLSEDDEPGWVMGTISKTVQHHIQSIRQKQMRLDELPQPGWGESADHFCERDLKYGTTELKVLAVVTPQTDTTAATPSPTTLGELMQVLHIVPGQSQMLQVTSCPGSRQIGLGSEKPQADTVIVSLMPDAVPDLSRGRLRRPFNP